MLWCIGKPHRGEARGVSSHWVRKAGMKPRSCPFTKVLEQLQVLRNPFHLESGGAVPCAGSCMNPAVLTFTDQSVLDNT